MTRLTPHQLKALDYGRHISLTANAGSGKTFILSKRYVEIAVNENLSLNSIVAITFTDKAAGELNKKIAAEIEDRLLKKSDPEKNKVLSRLRRQLVSANISTIHSFCVNILREFSPEAGLDARFVPIDQQIADELIDLTIEESLNNLIRDEIESENLKYLIRFFGSKKLLVTQLRILIHNRRNILKLANGLYSKSEAEVASHFRNYFQKGITEIFQTAIKDAMNVIAIINSKVILEAKDNSNAVEINSILKKMDESENIIHSLTLLGLIRDLLLTKKGTVRQQGYLKKNMIEQLDNEINIAENFFQSIKGVEITEDYEKSELELARFGKILLEVFMFVNSKYSEKKKQKGFLDFEDILLFTQDLIKQEEVRKYLNERFKYIMIDEYQDTNEIQYNIFMPILNHLKSGNLFVVGDEKQSIYMFRDAELEIFNKTKIEIVNEADQASLLQLPHSFRLAPQIALFTNILFNKLFQNTDKKFNEVEYNELVCAKRKNEKGGVEILIADESETEMTESELIASRIVKFVREENKEISNFSDIAILCRKRTAFAELESAFLKFKIPFIIVGGKGFYQKHIIYDLYNYLTFLLNKKNDPALVGILRSPFFTISDLELFEISLEDGKSFYSKLISYSKSHSKYVSIIDLLKKHLKIAGKSDITFLVRSILKETGYRSVIASRTNAKQELANIEKLIRISSSYSSQSFRTLYDFVNYLAESIKTLDDEAQAALAAEENAVKIMTLHQAKGLEFKAVFLYKCNEYTKEDKVKSKSIGIDKEMGILTKVPIDGNYFEEYSAPPIVGLYNYVMKRKQLSEIKRLLYVGVTRAENYLFISGSVKDNKLQNDSFMKLIVEGLELDLSSSASAISSELKFMEFDGNNFATKNVPFSIDILLVREIRDVEQIAALPDSYPGSKKMMFETIDDFPRREIISATKIAVFLQCPVKYQLIYELGYSKLYQMIKKHKHEFEFNYNEDEETKSFADVKGRIIHAVLESETGMEGFSEKVKSLLDDEIKLNNIQSDDLAEVEQAISSSLNNFYKSDTYELLKSFTEYKNEIEVYTEEKNYYLYGIIDKLVINDKKALIIDYKTDSVDPENIDQKADGYLPQLKFYSYIINKLYPYLENFELWILFIKEPERIVKEIISSDDLLKFGKSIENIVTQIRAEQFKPNTDHCKICHFYVDNKNCIKGKK